jgi:hypothetical protein
MEKSGIAAILLLHGVRFSLCILFADVNFLAHPGFIDYRVSLLEKPPKNPQTNSTRAGLALFFLADVGLQENSPEHAGSPVGSFPV